MRSEVLILKKVNLTDYSDLKPDNYSMIFAQSLTLDTNSLEGVPFSMEHVSSLQQMTDEELLLNSLKKPDLFEILVSRYQRQFLERATFVVKDRDEAEDIVQDTFVRIYRFAPRFRGEEGTFKAWGTTILMNVARTRYQKKAKSWARFAPLTPEHYESLKDDSLDVDASYAKDELERAFLLMDEETANILKQAYIENVPYQEIAEKEGISVGAVKTRVHRGKKVLRDIVLDRR